MRQGARAGSRASPERANHVAAVMRGQPAGNRNREPMYIKEAPAWQCANARSCAESSKSATVAEDCAQPWGCPAVEDDRSTQPSPSPRGWAPAQAARARRSARAVELASELFHQPLHRRVPPNLATYIGSSLDCEPAYIEGGSVSERAAEQACASSEEEEAGASSSTWSAGDREKASTGSLSASSSADEAEHRGWPRRRGRAAAEPALLRASARAAARAPQPFAGRGTAAEGGTPAVQRACTIPLERPGGSLPPGAQAAMQQAMMAALCASHIAAMFPGTVMASPTVGPPPGLGLPPAAASSARSSIADQKAVVANAGRTTVMLRNLPNNYTRRMLLALLDAKGFAGLYDFVYVPRDFVTQAGLGFAFVNLLTPADALRIHEVLVGFKRWSIPSSKVCAVGWAGADQQGLEANIRRYRNSSVMHESVPEESKPLMLVGGARAEFPASTRRLWPPHEGFGSRAARRGGA